MTVTEKFSTHAEPVWRDRTDFIIHAPLPEVGRFEQLWTRRVGENQFEICCIPFFLYDVALGDIVETTPQGTREYLVSRVLKRSGRYVFRVYFKRSQYRYREETFEALRDLGALLEWSSRSWLAIDARDHVHAQEIADYLHGQEQAKRSIYETGKTA